MENKEFLSQGDRMARAACGDIAPSPIGLLANPVKDYSRYAPQTTTSAKTQLTVVEVNLSWELSIFMRLWNRVIGSDYPISVYIQGRSI